MNQRLYLLWVLALAVFVLPSASAQAAPTITEYSTHLPASAAPLGISTDAEGELWVSENGGSTGFARITAAGAITSYTKLTGPPPRELTRGIEGDLWFTESEGNANIGLLLPSTEEYSEYSLPSGSNPVGITPGPEGDLWFAEAGGNAKIGRITPLTHEITEFPLAVKASKPADIALGPEGDLWFTESANPGAIGRIDPATDQITEYSEGLTANSTPWGITKGPEGDMWFTEAVNPGRIGRIDPRTGVITEFSAGLTAGTPVHIVAGSDGNLYFTESNGVGAIGRITPAGAITEYTEASGLTAKSKPGAITSGPDGNIWFAESASPARVGRLTVAPSVSSQSALLIGSESAQLGAELGANAQSSEYFIEYGPTSSYGSRTATASAGNAAAPVSVLETLSGLEAGSAYHFRFVATNASGTTYGADSTFTTSAKASAISPVITETSVVALPGETVPEPVIGRVAALSAASGVVRVKLPHTNSFVALQGSAGVPVGSVIETSHGAVNLTTALDGAGHTQTATVWGGVFEVGQKSHGNGMTELILRGARPVCARKGRAQASETRPARHRLWARDNHGRYSTHGADSVATVLGTEWETEDTCAGTITRVRRGIVSVRSLHTHRTVRVKAGHSFLARR